MMSGACGSRANSRRWNPNASRSQDSAWLTVPALVCRLMWSRRRTPSPRRRELLLSTFERMDSSATGLSMS